MTTKDPFAPPETPIAQDDVANPYAAPEVAATIERQAYSLGQVVCGTFFGSLFCTAFMVRNNYKAFGKDSAATKAFWILFVCGIAVTVVSMFIPGNFGGTILALISLFVMSNWYTSHMQRDFNAYTRTKGRRISNWWVFGLIMLCLVCLMGAAMAVAVGLQMMGITLAE